MEKQKQPKDQFVVAHLTQMDNSETVVSNAIFLAKMLNKGLILLHISDERYTTLSTDEAGARLEKLQHQLSADERSKTLQISYCALKGDTKTIVNALPTIINAVVAVVEVSEDARRKSPTNKKEVLRNYAECKIAFLTVQAPLQDESTMKNVAMSIDFKRESKEKLIWASYFARFNASIVHVLYYDYKDEGLRYKWYSNMKFLTKFFNNLSLTFSPHIIDSHSTFTDTSAMKFAHENDYGMLLSVTTKEKDGIEMFIGVQEERTIVNPYRLPIMFINPREDIYVLCD